MKFTVAEYSPSLRYFAVTNKVALNVREKLGSLVLCNGVILNTEYHQDVPVGQIMMPGLFRVGMSLKKDQTVELTSFKKSGLSSIFYMTVHIDFMGTVTKEMKDQVYTTATFQEAMTHLTGLVLTVNGFYLIPGKGVNFRVLVEDIMVRSGEEVEMVRHGVFNNPTITIKSPLIAIPKEQPQHAIFKSNLDFETLGVGGIDEQFKEIFRRAFASRNVHPDELKKLGIKHQKGIILYGPPGTGKTALARGICKVLNSHEPIIVSGPEVLNKYVGGSEEKIRELFSPAEKEYAQHGDFSQLHVLIFDEFDSLCKSRSSGSDGGTNVGNTVVNQILSKIDGINSINNILLIGMTNRLDMIDSAILRPGRFGIHIEIGIPNEAGRLQILQIHTKSLRESDSLKEDVKLEYYAKKTENYSGAELELLVQEATSYLISRQLDLKNLKTIDRVTGQVSAEDFDSALANIKPAFGKSETDFIMPQELVEYGTFISTRTHITELVEKLKTSTRINLITILLHGDSGVGKSTIATSINTQFPFARLVRSDKLLKVKLESFKAGEIHSTFLDAYKSKLSYILLDDLERLMEYMNIGPRFSTTILQALIVLLSTPPPTGSKLFIIATTSNLEVIEDLGMIKLFNEVIEIPKLTNEEVMEFSSSSTEEDISVRDLLFKLS